MLGCWSWSPWQQIQVGGTPTSDNVFFTSDIPGSSTACTAISFLCFSRRVAEFYSYAQKSQHVPHTSLTFKINIQYSITFLSRSFVRKGNPVMKIRKMTTDLRVSVLIQSFYKHVLKTGGGVQVEFYEAIESGSVVLATRLLEFVFFYYKFALTSVCGHVYFLDFKVKRIKSIGVIWNLLQGRASSL